MTIVTPKPQIERDWQGRPYVIPVGGGKPITYTRCTTYISVLEDTYHLSKWSQRNVALGLASRPDLVLSVNAHRDDKKELDNICKAAREAAAASSAATTGTALHTFTEMIDRGQPLPEGLPANVLASLEKYVEATEDLKPTLIEQFCVQDQLKIGGTPDRVVKYKAPGKRVGTFIADLKTGSIDRGILKIAMQLSIYARSHTYDIATGARGDHGADFNKGLIIHLPAVDDPKDAVCTLHWVNLEQGWFAVQVATSVRDKRRLKFKDLTEPFLTVDHPQTADVSSSVTDQVSQYILACTDADKVRNLWASCSDVWTDDHTALAIKHIESLSA